MKRLVIGCGYVGERVAARWSAGGDEVFAVTRSADRAAEFRAAGWHPIVADVTDPDSLATLPPVDTVLHAVGFDRSAGPSQREVYVDGLQNVLDALPPSVRRFVYVSSTSVYGQSDGTVVDEDSACEPVREGGRLCLAAEQAVLATFRDRPDAAATVLRFAGIYGPNRLLRRAASLLANEPIGGESESWLNLIHVDDGVAAVLLATDDDRARDRVYLVCDDEPLRRREYFGRLAEAVGAPPPQFDPSTGARHGAGGLNKRCTNRRLREELGFVPNFPSSSTGLPDAIARSAAAE